MQLSLFDIPGILPSAQQKKQPDRKPEYVRPKPQILVQTPKPLSQIYAGVLSEYLPGESIEYICQTLAQYKVFVKISRKRLTKLGDYCFPQNGKGHRITINHNLNKYSFLITLTHEIAHLRTWEKYKRRVKPHGVEWKREFRILMQPCLSKNIFPSEIVLALNNYLINPAAASCTDVHLLKALRLFDKKGQVERTYHLDEIPENSVFTIVGNSKRLRKGKKLRKRFLCSELNSKRKFLVSPVAEVVFVNN